MEQYIFTLTAQRQQNVLGVHLW
nr:unnamed protein product [Callosobruchus analis]